LLIEEFKHWFQESKKLIDPALQGINELYDILTFMEELLRYINEYHHVIFYKDIKRSESEDQLDYQSSRI
jgi:hypothetical protein